MNEQTLKSKMVLQVSDELWNRVKIYKINTNKKHIQDAVTELLERGLMDAP